MLQSTLVLYFAAFALADVYLHNPRGSNNRLDDENRDRNNANRLFDSQNNNRGGSNVGQVYYYAGSKVQMEWSAQHSCGNPNNHCEFIVQAMCEERVRDGTTQNTIPIRPNECYNWDCDTDVRFGRHESFESYMNCKYRKRNKGLFTSSQVLQGDSAIYTRQNPNGGRRGLECPEERDYYPYWMPTKWRDIAVFTNQHSRCEAYKANSQNVQDRSWCQVPITGFMRWYEGSNKRTLLPLDREECQNISYWDMETNVTTHGEWITGGAWGIAPPECHANVWSRDNHHGNVQGGEWTGFEWTVPDWMAGKEQCVLRLRYNISTGDFEGWDGLFTLGAGVNASNNKGPGGDETKPAKVDIQSFYGIPGYNPQNFSESRDYTLRNNPRPDAFYDPPVPLQLAINTAQYGRTFEDRTHKFGVRAVPSDIQETLAASGGRIHNVNVRGKRGNIVQTYPGTEYDFVPNKLYCDKNRDWVHFQWTGSNTNPNENAGQGRQGSDRHNVVALRAKNYEEPPVSQHITDKYGDVPVKGHLGNSYPHHLSQWSFLGFSRADMEHLAILTPNQYGGEMSELDDAGTYFDLGLRRCSQEGVYNYLCTRNNNFSNRSQQGIVSVSETAVGKFMLDATASSYVIAQATITTGSSASTEVQPVQVTSTPAASAPGFEQSGIVAASDVICLGSFNVNGGMTVNLSIKYEENNLRSFDFVRAANPSGPWEEIEDATFEDGVASAAISSGGCYTVQSSPNGGAITGIVFACLAGAGLIGFGLWWKFGRNRGTANKI